MDKNKILGMVDHTLLKQDATWEQIREIMDDGMTYHTHRAERGCPSGRYHLGVG